MNNQPESKDGGRILASIVVVLGGLLALGVLIGLCLTGAFGVAGFVFAIGAFIWLKLQ